MGLLTPRCPCRRQDLQARATLPSSLASCSEESLPLVLWDGAVTVISWEQNGCVDTPICQKTRRPLTLAHAEG